MKTTFFSLCSSGLLALLTGCASAPSVDSSVGPKPIRSAPGPMSYLQVFTDSESHQIGDRNTRYPHTSYRIYDASGKVVRFVRNHVGNMDETPSRVALPANHYTVVGESSGYTLVRIPVMIEEGRLTTVHLDGAWTPPTNVPKSSVVYLPDGEAVGWK